MNSESPQLPWHSRFDLQGITFALFILLGISSLPALEGSGRDLDYWGNLKGFLDQFLPPDFDILPQTLAGIWETIQIAGISTLLATVLSLVLALGAARTLSPAWLVMLTRMLLNCIRTIPSLLWAILAVVLVGWRLGLSWIQGSPAGIDDRDTTRPERYLIGLRVDERDVLEAGRVKGGNEADDNSVIHLAL